MPSPKALAAEDRQAGFMIRMSGMIIYDLHPS
jgi:hypothetical protein